MEVKPRPAPEALGQFLEAEPRLRAEAQEDEIEDGGLALP